MEVHQRQELSSKRMYSDDDVERERELSGQVKLPLTLKGKGEREYSLGYWRGL